MGSEKLEGASSVEKTDSFAALRNGKQKEKQQRLNTDLHP
jgi:hypothetical protein